MHDESWPFSQHKHFWMYEHHLCVSFLCVHRELAYITKLPYCNCSQSLPLAALLLCCCRSGLWFVIHPHTATSKYETWRRYDGLLRKTLSYTNPQLNPCSSARLFSLFSKQQYIDMYRSVQYWHKIISIFSKVLSIMIIKQYFAECVFCWYLGWFKVYLHCS